MALAARVLLGVGLVGLYPYQQARLTRWAPAGAVIAVVPLPSRTLVLSLAVAWLGLQVLRAAGGQRV